MTTLLELKSPFAWRLDLLWYDRSFLHSGDLAPDSSLHLVVQFCLAWLLLSYQRRQKTENPKSTQWPEWHHYLVHYVPCAVCTGFDVGFSNIALQQMTVTTGMVRDSLG